MFERRILNIITFAFMILMLFKISSFHVYSHEDAALDQIENCKICEDAIENQNSEHLADVIEWFDTPQNILYDVTSTFNTTEVPTSTKLHFRLFGRPPPAGA